jgi:hypothetical protein
MRLATALPLIIGCGVLLECCLLPLSYLIAGRGSFRGGGLLIEYLSSGQLPHESPQKFRNAQEAAAPHSA